MLWFRSKKFGSYQGRPICRKKPPIDDRSAVMSRNAGGAVAFEVPKLYVMKPGYGAGLDAFEAQIRVLIVAKHIVLIEAAQFLEPASVTGHERPGNRGDGPGPQETLCIRGRALAVMFDTCQLPLDDLVAPIQGAFVDFKVHSAM